MVQSHFPLGLDEMYGWENGKSLKAQIVYECQYQLND